MRQDKELNKLHHRRRLQKLRYACLVAYGGNPPRCACCGEDCVEFLSLDHEHNDGYLARQGGKKSGNTIYPELKRLGFPKDRGLRVLCYNCNIGRERNGGVCPHLGKIKLLGEPMKPRRAKAEAQPLPQDPTEIQGDLFS